MQKHVTTGEAESEQSSHVGTTNINKRDQNSFQKKKAYDKTEKSKRNIKQKEQQKTSPFLFPSSTTNDFFDDFESEFSCLEPSKTAIRFADSQKPSARSTSRFQAKELVLLGGKTSPHYVRTCNASATQWNQLRDFPDVSFEGQLARYKRKLYQFGGRNTHDLNSFSDVWSLDTQKSLGMWKKCAHMNDKRHRFGYEFYRNQLYVAGGRAHKTKILSTVESYSPTEDYWVERSDMTEKRTGCCLVAHKAKLWALGGQNGSAFLKSVECYEGGDYWTCGEDMLHRRADFAAVSLNHRIYAIGGKARANFFSSSVETFFNGSWKFVASLKAPRAGHSACILENKIYVVGGENHSGPVKTIEVYSPEQNEWKVIGEIRGDPIGVSVIAM